MLFHKIENFVPLKAMLYKRVYQYFFHSLIHLTACTELPFCMPGLVLGI